jgi:3'5'-cyclic nucleotide phosphodiesterase
MAFRSMTARSSLKSHSAWEDGLNLIEELLEQDSATAAAMTEEQQLGLKRLRVMLLSGYQSNENHIPAALLLADMTANNNFLLCNFAGYVRPEEPAKKFAQIISAHKVARFLKNKAQSSRMQLSSSFSDIYLPEQWFKLDQNAQRRLCDLLSWKNLNSWDFNVFDVDEVLNGNSTLVFVAWAILASPHAQYAMEKESRQGDGGGDGDGDLRPIEDREGYHFPDQLGIKDQTLTEYFVAIERQYLDNPYHNKIHAADVVQTTHALIQMGGSKFACSDNPVELFALLVAAVVHDVGHPGMNNSYQISSKSDLALVYNDKSVLENMHASRAFQIIMGDQKDAKCDILSSFTDELRETFRNIVIKSVLSTDMTKHFSKKNFIKGILLNNELESSNEGPSAIDTSDPLTKTHILGYILHLADISNPAKSTPVASRWADQVLEEFFQQGDKEAELALPISPLCDRRTTSRSQSQTGFINFIVLPAYELLAQLIPQVETIVIPHIRTNLEYWEDQKRLEGEKTVSSDPATKKPC